MDHCQFGDLQNFSHNEREVNISPLSRSISEVKSSLTSRCNVKGKISCGIKGLFCFEPLRLLCCFVMCKFPWKVDCLMCTLCPCKIWYAVSDFPQYTTSAMNDLRWDFNSRNSVYNRPFAGPGTCLCFGKSHCATCSPVYVVLYYVTGSCKGPILYSS